MSPEDNYIICKSRRNRPQIHIAVCTQCKKKVGCKGYILWLETHAAIMEYTPQENELRAIREVSVKAKKEKPKPKVNVFEWKD